VLLGNNKITENVVPDFAIRIVDGELELTLNGRNAPSLHVSKDYQENDADPIKNPLINQVHKRRSCLSNKIRFG
jgi:DNA-directed RNA polymerase specialized sigma54-like protein